jgi:hypothetical protein
VKRAGPLIALLALQPLPAPSAEGPVPQAPRKLYVGAVGRGSDREAGDPAAWARHELPDWQDPATGTNVIQDRKCGVRLKLGLVGTRRHNYLELVLESGREAVRIDPGRIEFSFGSPAASDSWKPSGFKVDPGPRELAPGDQLYAAVPFPDKADFRGQDEIRVRVPIGDCVAEETFRRPPGQAERAESGRVWSGLQLGLELGGGIGRTGSLGSAVGNGVRFNIAFVHYLSLHHGYWAALEYDGLGSGGVTGLALLGGYSYRHYLADRWTVHADVGPGIYQFSSPVAEQPLKQLDYAFVAGMRLGVDWTFGRTGEPRFIDSDHALGILLADNWLPWASIQGVPAAGQSFSLQLRYLFGM